ncbi:hypothetical protein OZK63_33000 [Streptomyces sp. UMAF16]|nr:hypothetical protein [Streptomyces sp. UMAF16]
MRRADHHDEELRAPSASGGSWHGTRPTETVVLNDARNRIGYVPPRWPTGWAIASPRSTSGC